jgi:phenylalanine-4-hydroxylase
MAITHVFDTPPPGAQPDWTMPQNWEAFTAEQHSTWDRLVARQAQALPGYASGAFLAGLDILRLSKPGIPDFRELNGRLTAATGWQVVAVPGAIPNDAFFHHLAERRFPAANFLRGPDSLDYSEEPDLFHDLFGHLPMLTNPTFADFMHAYGQAGLRAESLGAAELLGNLYLYTVEFGLVAENGGLRGYGAGLLSSYSETIHALTSSSARRLRFDLRRVMRTNYLFDEFQRVYFVVDSFDHLLTTMEEANLAEIYQELQDAPRLAPDAVCPSDVAFVL